LSIQNDAALLYGEIGASPLKSIHAILTSQHVPVSSSSSDWGKANSEQKEVFSTELDRFAISVTNALDSLKSGPLLRRSDNPVFESYHSMDRKRLLNSIPDKASFLVHLQQLLEEWCDQIEAYLTPNSSEANSTDFNDSDMSNDRGPKGELNFWRGRMQLVTSVTEQVNSEHSNQVVNLLTEISKNPGDDSKPRILLLLRRWRQVDVFITETANEAKDNIKYLSSLQRFVEAFYDGSINAMVDAVPAMLNSVKVRFENNNEFIWSKHKH
jgi:dynein heavy chain, axonemal